MEEAEMPYQTTDDLPARGVRDHLPAHAQEIFLEAFNSAYEAYADPLKRRSGASLEETANRIAWAAVKRRYVELGDRWVRCH
jgi:cation transport regulator